PHGDPVLEKTFLQVRKGAIEVTLDVVEHADRGVDLTADIDLPLFILQSRMHFLDGPVYELDLHLFTGYPLGLQILHCSRYNCLDLFHDYAGDQIKGSEQNDHCGNKSHPPRQGCSEKEGGVGNDPQDGGDYDVVHFGWNPFR